MTELIAVAVITILAVISPGADFAMITRNSYLYGRRAGILAAIGIASGILVHVAYTILGIGILIAHSPNILLAIKVAGAIYLIYIGYKTITSKTEIDVDINSTKQAAITAFRTGFLTNVLNPKSTLFVVSTFTQIVSPSTSIGLQMSYGIFMSLMHLIWFISVAVFFSHYKLRAAMLEKQTILNRVIGVILMGFGVSLGVIPIAN
ncbi:LysE family translocator [Xenorhabdus hominickii]|uniref:Lysine transporter LysE n=1 Tax=Xenorhabdus hominickii TaxID=351679 RepID=A0A2G0Q3H4_XENHO|nr:LysE family translocator [Xenorhabdus hominickii]AOM39980.1 lysine transporter LysE [Xenorhabdus hominickii]PHM52020.1 lysine transporter LysE [Xenorhabdus hominickii]PHM52980.1 lysine transporter LysE [Xenorhabdus hominickii]PHM53774.1 lysine transporter LysE [Xenorhabdus hominickii]